MSKLLTLSGRFFLLASAFTLATACGSDGDSNGPGGGGTTTTFAGIISSDDGLSSGSIEFVVETASPAPPAGSANLLAPVNITGTLKMGGTVSLTGTYDAGTKDLVATGGGYTLGGVYNGTTDELAGGWTGPGNTSGVFLTTKGTGGTAYCGTYDADDQSDNGTFSMLIRGTKLSGQAVSAVDGGTIELSGTVNNNNISVNAVGIGQGFASGTRNGTAVAGTWDDGSGTTGTWTGSTAACQ